jgi:undecaprenyl-diphosphatase
MQQIDTQLFLFIHGFSDKGSFNDAAIVFFADRFPNILLFIAIILVFRNLKLNNIRNVYGYFLAIISAYVAERGVRELIGHFYYRIRPYHTFEVSHLLSSNSHSFPSGHSMFFFALSAGVFLVNRKLGYVFYASALIMGLARVAAGMHYPSDILGGMILGTLTTLVLNRIYVWYAKLN